MKTKNKCTVTRKSKQDNYPIFVEVEFLKKGKEFRRFSFMTETNNLRIVHKFCKTRNKAFIEEVYQYLVDDQGNYDVLFNTTHLSDPLYFLNPKFNEQFNEYSHLVQHYLCCFDSVPSFLDKNRIDASTFFISIDVSDETKTCINNSVIKDIIEEEQSYDNQQN